MPSRSSTIRRTSSSVGSCFARLSAASRSATSDCSLARSARAGPPAKSPVRSRAAQPACRRPAAPLRLRAQRAFRVRRASARTEPAGELELRSPVPVAQQGFRGPHRRSCRVRHRELRPAAVDAPDLRFQRLPLRARLQVDGTIYETFGFICEYDFANQNYVAATNTATTGADQQDGEMLDLGCRRPLGAEPSCLFQAPPPRPRSSLLARTTRRSSKDVFVELKQIPIFGTIRIGHHKEWYSMEELTFDNFITFMERSAGIAFVPVRNSASASIATGAPTIGDSSPPASSRRATTTSIRSTRMKDRTTSRHASASSRFTSKTVAACCTSAPPTVTPT